MGFNDILKEKKIAYLSDFQEENGLWSKRKFYGKCLTCGATQVYDKYNLADTKVPCENCRAVRNLHEGRVYGSWRIEKIGLINSVYMADMVCTKCGTKRRAALRAFKERGYELSCPRCERIALKKKQEQEAPKFKKAEVRDAVASDDRESLYKMGKVIDVVVSTVSDDKTQILRNTISAFKPNKDPNVVVNGLKVTHMIQGEKNRLICSCGKCKSNVILTRNAVMATKNASCPVCEFISKRAAKIESIDTDKVIGQYFYGLKVMSVDNNMMATVRCKYHNKKKQEFIVPLTALKLHTEQAVCPHCKAERTMVKVTCPSCGRLISNQFAAGFGNTPDKVYRCVSCKIDFTQGDFINNSDKNLEYYDKISKYTQKGMVYRGINRDTGVAKFCLAFIGRDGKERFNCYCAEHRQELILTQEEYDNYESHKYCNKETSKFIKMVPTHSAKKKDDEEKSLLEELKD